MELLTTSEEDWKTWMHGQVLVGSCPRCEGAVELHPPQFEEEDTCVNCGWRRAEIPPDVQRTVQEHQGEDHLPGEIYRHRDIGKGKSLPLSGAAKKRREKAKRAAMEEG